jgi:predicted  nucleic acid-binding Zn-ribbon protein
MEDIHTLKELWERLTSVETTLKQMQRCNDISKDKLEDVKETVIALEVEVTSIREAIKIAKDTVDTRLEGMNEFRNQLKDQASTFIPRSEYLTHYGALIQRLDMQDIDIRGLRESRAELKGKASQNSVTISYIIGVASLMLALVSLVLRALGV